MKKIYYKYKILVNGLCTITPYSIDGFTLKTAHFDENILEDKYNDNKDGIDVNLNSYLSCCITDFEKMSYCYFESDNYEELEVSKKKIINSATVTKLLQAKLEIYNRINDLERKLRLVLNIPVLFQIVCIEFYDEEKNFLTAVQGNRQLSSWNRLTYNLDSEEVTKNSMLKIDYNSLKSIENFQFQRALELYNNSFESEILSNRFIFIFSSFEAIFNLDSEDITEKLSRNSAKLLAEGNKEEFDVITSDIKKLYKKRSDYIHGAKIDGIFEEDEKLLRLYVRKIILAYWIIILSTKKTAKQILQYLNSDEKLDLNVRIFINVLNASNFNEQKHRVVEIIEKEFEQKIPLEIMEKLFC